MKKKARKRTSIPLRIETIDINSVKPHPQNTRLHDERNIQTIANSLGCFGQRTPIVIRGKYVIKGNGTLEAAKRLNWTMIQVVRADALSEAQAISYAIADNKTSDLSEFDFEALAGVLKDLQGQDVDLASTGFQQFEVEPLIQAEFSGEGSGEIKEREEKWRLVFTDEQWEQVGEAIEIARTRLEDGEHLSAVDVFVSICLWYTNYVHTHKPLVKPAARKRRT